MRAAARRRAGAMPAEIAGRVFPAGKAFAIAQRVLRKARAGGRNVIGHKMRYPQPRAPSGSCTISAKLCVLVGALLHTSAGERFSPVQLGLLLALPANFFLHHRVIGKGRGLQCEEGSGASLRAAEQHPAAQQSYFCFHDASLVTRMH